MQKRTIEFIRKNAAAKKPFDVDYWPVATSFLGFPNRVTASGGLSQEALARLDVWIGNLMSELKNLGIAENTLVILMADNGPMTHNGPPGMAETLYRGGKGDYLEGARARSSDGLVARRDRARADRRRHHPRDRIVHHVARLAGRWNTFRPTASWTGSTKHALFLKGDTFSRRDYVFIYTGNVLAATVKGRYKRVWVDENPGLSGAAPRPLH